MGLSPESRKAEESLEEQKDELQREPKGEFLSAGISELVFHRGVQLCSVCVSGGRSAPSRPARRRRRRGARREPQSGRRHFSLRQRRGLGRGDSGHGERLRLRLRLRRRRRGEAGPGAHHGAGEGADRRGQRTGALAADDGQVLSEVHWEARRRPGQLRAEVHRHVHGPVHGLLEHSFASLQFSAAAGESQHVTPAGLRAERDHVGKGQRPVQVVRGESCCLPSPCHGRAIKPR